MGFKKFHLLIYYPYKQPFISYFTLYLFLFMKRGKGINISPYSCIIYTLYMNIVKNINQYDENNIYFSDPIKNNVIIDGTFTRIIYSTPIFILNGISLLIPLNDIYIEKYYNKYKCSFNVNSHLELIESIKSIEENILKIVNIKNKIPQFKIYEQIKSGYIKVFSDVTNRQNSSFILKISGIWETQHNYGLTYKFEKFNYAL